MMLKLAAPAPLDGDRLQTELAAAQVDVEWEDVWIDGAFIVFSQVGEEHRQAIESVLSAHSGAPSEEAVAVANEQDAIAAAAPRAQQVVDGQATYTASEMAELVAWLVLREHRRIG